MKHAFAGLAPLLLVGLAAFASQDKDKPAAPKPDLAKTVAIVDMNRVTNEYPWKTQVQELLTKKWAELAVPYETALKQLRAEQAEASSTAERSRARMQHEIQIDILSYQVKVLRDVLKDEQQDVQLRLFTDVYREIRKATREIATKRGVLLVLRSRESDTGLPGMEVAENREREVIFFDKALDITDLVIDYLKALPPPRPSLDGPSDKEKASAAADKPEPAKSESAKPEAGKSPQPANATGPKAGTTDKK
jgi:Skp family chaperone for outer membrane proteins